VRLHLYDTRFLAITHHFAPIAGLTSLYLLAVRGLSARVPRARGLLVGAGLLWLVGMLPAPRPSASYEALKRIAAALAEKAPNGVLLGGYWETYVFASLQPDGTMTPVSISYDRTPWTVAALDDADEVIVEHGQSVGWGWSDPPARITPFGRAFRLRDRSWHQESGHAFALYATATERILRDDFEQGSSPRWSRTVGAAPQR
jgi:hypothetical protein